MEDLHVKLNPVLPATTKGTFSNRKTLLYEQIGLKLKE
jgi:hypothetical protein